MQGYILHIMNYAASYRGNFIDSLEQLDSNLYLFTQEARGEASKAWIEEMKARGCVVEFLSGNRNADVGLIRRMVKQYDVKAIHTHFITMSQYLSIYQATFASKLPIFMHMHNHSRKADNPIKNIIRRQLYKKCIMVACSESVYKSLERDYPANKKYAIDNGVNFERLEQYQELKCSDFDLPENEKVFLIFGFDFYRKGVDLALKALNDLRKKGHSFSLLISLSTNFEQVEGYVKEILGEMPSWVKIIPARNDVATLYNFVDLFLSPSREEGLPYSVIEAAYSSCGVVLSDISAQAHLKIEYGYWFESENIEKFEEQILKAVEEHDEKLKNWDSVKENMKKNYALEAWKQKVEKLYKQEILS